MDGFDDLAVVDALQVDRSDAEVAVAELALDDDQRHAFASELDGMRVPELVRREAPTDAGRDGRPAQLRAGGRAGPVPASNWSVDDAEQRTDRKLDSQLEPRAKLLPGAFVHADLTASSALAVADEQRAAAVIEIGFGEAEGFLRSPARQRITIRPRGRRAWAPSPALRMTATISSTFGGSAG